MKISKKYISFGFISPVNLPIVATSCGIEKIKISGGPACPRQKQSTTVEFELTLVDTLIQTSAQTSTPPPTCCS